MSRRYENQKTKAPYRTKSNALKTGTEKSDFREVTLLSLKLFYSIWREGWQRLHFSSEQALNKHTLKLHSMCSMFKLQSRKACNEAGSAWRTHIFWKLESFWAILTTCFHWIQKPYLFVTVVAGILLICVWQNVCWAAKSPIDPAGGLDVIRMALNIQL